MKTGPYRYLVEVIVTFTAREVLALYGASQSHYDSKCKAASKPRTSGMPYGGEICGLINRLPALTTVDGESNDDYAKRACSADPDATVETCLSTSVLGTLGKIAEMPGIDPGEGKTLLGLRIGIKRALLSANDEYQRLNYSPED